MERGIKDQSNHFIPRDCNRQAPIDRPAALVPAVPLPFRDHSLTGALLRTRCPEEPLLYHTERLLHGLQRYGEYTSRL